MMQGYDSVVLEADVELGGTDQKFNLLLARTLQERAGQEPQVCLILPLLRGTDGERKMSKSYDNYVGIAMDPNETFGRVMSIPDALLDEWLTLVSSATGDDLAARRAARVDSPLETKRWLAFDIVKRYHGVEAAEGSREAFDRVHRRRETPEEVSVVTIDRAPAPEGLWVAHVLRDAGLAASSSEAVRLVEQGAVSVDGAPVTDRDFRLATGEYLLQRGKRRFVRVRIP